MSALTGRSARSRQSATGPIAAEASCMNECPHPVMRRAGLNGRKWVISAVADINPTIISCTLMADTRHTAINALATALLNDHTLRATKG